MVYVLASFLLCWTDRIRSMEFQDLIMFLQVCVVVCVGCVRGWKGGPVEAGGSGVPEDLAVLLQVRTRSAPA